VTAGYANDLSAATSIIPVADNTYTLGNVDYRWAEIFLGPGTLHITDQTLLTDVSLTVDNGVLEIDGANQLQVGELRFVDNTIESTSGATDIEIGLLESTADIVLNRNVVIGDGKSLTFEDATVQTTAYIPPVDTSFVVAGGTAGTQPTFTGDPLFTGSYTKSGDQVHFQIQVDMDNITGFGTGQYYLDLPFPSKYPYKFRDGCLHDISASKDYAIGGHVAAGSSRLYLFSTDTQSGAVFDIEFDYNSPITLATADNFHIAGTYIADEA
jgi:hypothetical protein